MRAKEWLLTKGMSSRQFYALLLSALMVVGVMVYAVVHSANVGAATYNTALVPSATFKPIEGMTGVVTRNDGTNLIGLYWVTFARDSDKLSMTGFSLHPFMLGARVHLVQASAAMTPAGMPSKVFFVMPDSEPR
jgi:hypothetical protein